MVTFSGLVNVDSITIPNTIPWKQLLNPIDNHLYTIDRHYVYFVTVLKRFKSGHEPRLMTGLNQACQGRAQHGQIYARNGLVSPGFSHFDGPAGSGCEIGVRPLPTALSLLPLLADKQDRCRPYSIAWIPSLISLDGSGSQPRAIGQSRLDKDDERG